LYAMYSLIQREIQSPSSTPNGETEGQSSASKPKIPEFFTDPGYGLLGTSVLSTSNCGNPALRLFGFGPVTPEGYGIGESTPHPISSSPR
jgi:carnitine O-acetyltransferase